MTNTLLALGTPSPTSFEAALARCEVGTVFTTVRLDMRCTRPYGLGTVLIGFHRRVMLPAELADANFCIKLFIIAIHYRLFE